MKIATEPEIIQVLNEVKKWSDNSPMFTDITASARLAAAEFLFYTQNKTMFKKGK